jgi:hypothetical protein
MAIVLNGTSGITTPALDSVARFATADMPIGSVIQVVNATYSTETGSSSSAFADTGLTATITPTSATSKIVVFVDMTGCGKAGSTTTLNLRLLRNSTAISTFETAGGSNGSSAGNFIGACSVCYQDAPATTSATTYKVQLSSGSNTSVDYVCTASSMSTITLMEIAA